jgi:hypothetical protein
MVAVVATMTDPRPGNERAERAAVRRPARSQRPAAVVYGGSAVAFVAVLAALSWQVAAGADPAIGEGEQAAPAAPAKRVLVRRIVRRVVVTDEAPATVAAPSATPSPSAAAPAAPTTRSS